MQKLIFLAIILLLGSGCASIVSKSYYPVDIRSTPEYANIQIMNRAGNVIYNGSTPAYVQLKSGTPYFRKEFYTVRFEKEGYREKELYITSDIDGWYFGNILFGGIIGFLIVDPLSGAMYKINERYLEAYLSPVSADNQRSGLKIIELEELPEKYHQYLQKIDQLQTK